MNILRYLIAIICRFPAWLLIGLVIGWLIGLQIGKWLTT